MEFRPTRRGRRGVEPMPFVRERTDRELNRANNMMDVRKRLPAWNVRGNLLRAVANNQVRRACDRVASHNHPGQRGNPALLNL